MSRRSSLWFAAAFLGCTGCLSANAGRREATAILASRFGPAAMGKVAPEDETEVDASVNELLSKTLSSDHAVKIALLRSPDVKAAFDRIGIARGEWVSAVRLPNPIAQANLRFRAGRSTPDVDVGGAIDLRDFVLLPLRAKAANDDLDATSIEAAGLSMDVAFHTRDAYVEYLAVHQMVELEKSIAVASDASAELAKALRDAGNTPSLPSLAEQATYEEARLAYSQAQADEVAARSRLNLLMGLSGDEGAAWKPADGLGDPPGDELALKDVESKAVRASLDLAELRARYAAADGRVDLAAVEGAVPSLQAGAIAELDPEGWGVGPQVGIGIPLFYQGEGEIASARAERKVAQSTAASTAAQIRWLARTLAVDLTTARQRAIRFKTAILPLRQQIVDETQRQYNAMGVSAFQLFQAKRDQIESMKAYVASLQTYWKTRGELEMLLAGRMPDEALTGMSLSWQALRAKEMPR